MHTLTALIVFFLLFLGFHRVVKAQEFTPVPQADSLGAQERALSWEDQEFERIMRLRAIHAGTRPFFHHPAPFPPSSFIVITPGFGSPAIFCPSLFSPGCPPATRIIIIDRQKRDKLRN